jgi:hypothetical protein
MPKPIQKSKIQFALRAADKTYWDGRSRRRLRHGAMAAWYPKLSAVPTFWSTQKKAASQWKKYELERLCGEDVPPLHLVQYKLEAVETNEIILQVSFADTVYERIKRAHGLDFSQAFLKVTKECDSKREQIEEYKYAFRRRGATKTIIEEQMPEAISYGFVTIVKSERDWVYARMLLGSQFTEHWEMAPFYDINTPLG